jgi:hypothetical protein
VGKADELRALREAAYARRQALQPGHAAAAVRLSRSGVTVASATGAAGSQSKGKAKVADEALCGHTNMGGKACIRPRDHSEKNHRYAKAAK